MDASRDERVRVTHWCVAFFSGTKNPTFIALGLPLGLGLGSLYGRSLDRKAEAEGRVLKFS